MVSKKQELGEFNTKMWGLKRGLIPDSHRVPHTLNHGDLNT